MPIRFRCAYCNQLLGIARRKAGTVVRCPTCAGQVVVPSVDQEPMATQAPPPPSPAAAPPVFEQSDFADMFSQHDSGEQPAVVPGAAPAPPPHEPPAGAWGTHGEPPFGLEPVGDAQVGRPAGFGAAAPAGIVLSPTKATVLTVVAIVALAIAFGLGFTVGYLFRAPQASGSGQAAPTGGHLWA